MSQFSILNLLYLWFSICCLSKDPIPVAQCFPKFLTDSGLTK